MTEILHSGPPAPARKSRNNCIPMKTPGLYSVRLHVLGGHLEAAAMAAIAGLAAKHGAGYVHITTRQGLEIQRVPEERIDSLLAELAAAGLATGGTGTRVRTVIACTGIDCRHALIDSQRLARRLFDATSHRTLPHKFKISVAGCPNRCAKPIENDFGVHGVCPVQVNPDACNACTECLRVCPIEGAIGFPDGRIVHDPEQCIGCGKCARACTAGAWEAGSPEFVVWLGGTMGRRVRLADRLPWRLRDEDDVVRLLCATLDWYCEKAGGRERFGAVIDRHGLGDLVRCLWATATDMGGEGRRAITSTNRETGQ
jgi:anaerobic sulfite reductase subunit C